MKPARFLTTQQVVLLHDHVIAEIGGSAGLRDARLLDSAVHQAQATYGGDFLHPTVFDMAAAYLLYIASSHPFVNGNKRTAWFSCRTFLLMNGYRVRPRLKAVLALMNDVATGSERDWRVLSEWLADRAEEI